MTNEDDLRLAEYALGLLPPAEAGQVEAAVERDPVLQERLNWWQEHFARLEGEGTLPRDLWPAIAARLPANDNRANGWRALAISASGIAAALVLYVGVRPVTPPPPLPPTISVPSAPPLVAVLGGEEGTQVAISVDRTAGRLSVAPQQLVVGRRDAELWIIPADGRARSLGVIAAATRTERSVPTELRGYLDEGVTFAISLEPKGGSPTGSATGPIVATGKLFRA